MIQYIKGIVTNTFPGKVIIENNGIGYIIHMPDSSIGMLNNCNDLVTIYTNMIVREEDISLYGFTDMASCEMFNLLLTVSGVGAKGAMAVLSALGVDELKKAIAFDDSNLITKANGIGKKTAQRIVIDLKDKIGDISQDGALISSSSIETGSAKDEAVSALISLGYTKSEAMSFMVGIKDDNLSAEEYIRLALKSRR